MGVILYDCLITVYSSTFYLVIVNIWGTNIKLERDERFSSNIETCKYPSSSLNPRFGGLIKKIAFLSGWDGGTVIGAKISVN